MSTFTKNLPMVIAWKKTTGQETKIQGNLQNLTHNSVVIALPAKNSFVHVNAEIKVNFFIKTFEFWFDTRVTQITSDTIIHLVKPKEIHKRKQRSTTRINLASLPFKFSIWEKKGLQEGIIFDISSTGCKFQTNHFVAEQQLLNIDIYISEPRHKFRIICQALVTWVKKEQSYDRVIREVGILFTTISSASIEKIESFINDKIEATHLSKNKNISMLNSYEDMYTKF